MRSLQGKLATLLLLLAASCGGGSSYVQFSPAEETPTRLATSDGRISVLIPPEALAEDVEVALTDRSLADAEAPGVEGRSLVVALELRGTMPAPLPDTGSGGETEDTAAVSAVDKRFIEASLSGSVDVSVKLPSPWPPATPLDVQAWNSASARYEPAGFTAGLSGDGLVLEFSVDSFGRYALYGPLSEEYPLPAPLQPQLLAASSVIRRIAWQPLPAATGYNLYRSPAGQASPSKLNGEPLTETEYIDILSQPGAYDYSVTALRGNAVESSPSPLLTSPAVDFDIIGAFGQERLQAPGQLLLDSLHGRLLICDTAAAVLLSYSPQGEFISRVASAGSVRLREPSALAMDPDDGRIYLCDRGYRQVFIYDAGLAYSSRFGGSGSGFGEFLDPAGIATDGGQLVVSDAQRMLLQRFTPLGVYLNDPLDPLDRALALAQPGALCRLGDGSLALCDPGNERVLLVADDWSAGAELLRPAPLDPLALPAAVVADINGNIYVSEPAMRRVSVFDSSGEYLFQFGAEGQLHVEFGEGGPQGLAYDPGSGYLYVADPAARRIAMFST